MSGHRKRAQGKAANPGSSDTTTADVLGWLENGKVERVAHYVSSGRRHASLRDADLIEAWCIAFRAMAADPWDKGLRSAEQDLGAEMDLRKLPAPYDAVKGDADRLIAAVSQAYDSMKADPESFEEANRELTLDINQFRIDRARPKN